MNRAAKLIHTTRHGVRELPLGSDEFIIGRSQDNHLELIDSLVSRRHTRIYYKDGAYRVLDLNSSNGTYVNNLRVTEKILNHGDAIRIGSTVLRFEDPDEIGTELPEDPREPPRSEELSAKSVKDLQPQYTTSFLDNSAGSVRLRDMIRSEPEAVENRDREHFLFLFKLADLINRAESFDGLLQRVMPMVFEGLNAERGVIMMRSGHSGPLARKIAQRADRLDPGDIPISSTIAQLVINEKKAVLTGDATLDPNLQFGQSIVRLNIRSALAAPIWVDDEVYGLIYIDNLLTTHAFTEADRDLLTAVGNQIGAAYHRETLKDQIRRDAVHRSNLERYHSPDVVEMILNQGDSVALEVENRQVTVLFSDIEGFSKLSERLTPKEIADLLNAYFEIMTRAIFDHKGSVNKFIGDAIMAIFGAPVERPDDPALAVKAAIRMIRDLAVFRHELPPDRRFRMRIGINSGQVVAGNIGARSRMEYTVLGDAVNVAARLEKIAPPDGIALGESTAAAVKHLFPLRDLGPQQLKGMGKELHVFEVLLGDSAEDTFSQPSF